jgi:hypothetical protein
MHLARNVVGSVWQLEIVNGASINIDGRSALSCAQDGAFGPNFVRYTVKILSAGFEPTPRETDFDSVGITTWLGLVR